MNVKSRRNNGFLYITRGECKYTFNGGGLTLSEGSIAYLPIGGAYTLTVTSEFFENYRTNFMLTINGENVRFSDVPIKLTDSATPECIEAMRTLEESFRLENNSISKTEKLCTVFSLLQNFSGPPKSLKLAPAVRYIHEHLHESFNIKTLSSLCFLSTTRFYALFEKEFGKTPLEYKNKLLLDAQLCFLIPMEFQLPKLHLCSALKALHISVDFLKSTWVFHRENLLKSRLRSQKKK